MKSSKRSIFTMVMALVLCVAFAFGLVACEPTNYNVTFVLGNGEEDVVRTVQENGTVDAIEQPVREGYTFDGWMLDGNAYDFATPVTSDITLTAGWTELPPETVRIKWNSADGVTYNFNGVEPRDVVVGTTVTFGITVSILYEGTPVVMAGETQLTADENGNYTFVANEATTVSVSGLTLADATINGSGTEEDPFVIESVVQYLAFVNAINSGDETYVEANIRLDADLDFQGYAIAPVGTDDYMFDCVFDGNGHTISNFTLDVEDGQEYFGLIGVNGAGSVKNLTVSADIEVSVDRVGYYFIGMIMGYNIGGDVINCTVNGSISVPSAMITSSGMVVVGGMVGAMQGYSTTHSGTVTGSVANLTITSTGRKEINCAGGIVGLTMGTSNSGMAVVDHCTFNGTIGTKIRNAGGIVGEMRDKSSVTNCYSTGSVTAQNIVRSDDDNDPNWGSDAFAAAGGIVGLAQNDTIIANCASTAALASKGEDLTTEIAGDIVGVSYADAHKLYSVLGKQAVVLDCVYSATGTANVDGTDYDLTNLADLCALLGWSANDWTQGEGTVLPKENDAIEFVVRFDFGTEILLKDGTTITYDDVTLTGYLPMNWIYHTDGINGFVSAEGELSNGFFFDEARTQRIPAAYFLTHEMTIYVGFVDYSNTGLDGEYCVAIGNTDVTITFDSNGTVYFAYDLIELDYNYYIDGDKVVILGAEIANLMWSAGANFDYSSDYYFELNKEDGSFVLYDIMFFNSNGILKAKELYGVTKTSLLGVWYTPDNVRYGFFSDGYCYTSDGKYYLYEVSGDTIVLLEVNSKGKPTGNSLTATLSESGVQMDIASTDGEVFTIVKYDEFRGAWESDYATISTISFDGNGFSNAGGIVTYKGEQITYTVVDGVATFGDVTAYFNEDKLLVVVDGGVETVYGQEGSCMGEWVSTDGEYYLILFGIGANGYGYGYDSNDILFTYGVEVYTDPDTKQSYEITSFYVGSTLYGQFVIDENGVMVLEGYFDDYSLTYTDGVYGLWVGDDGMMIFFNGDGAYNLEEDGVCGEVTLLIDDEEVTVAYVYDNETATATYSYDGVDYVAVVDGDTLVVTYNGESHVYTLHSDEDAE